MQIFFGKIVENVRRSASMIPVAIRLCEILLKTQQFLLVKSCFFPIPLRRVHWFLKCVHVIQLQSATQTLLYHLSIRRIPWRIPWL